MRITVFAIILAAMLATACAEKVKTTNSARVEPTPMPTVMIPKDGNYNSRGKVTKINLDLGSVELDHEDIPGVMAPMRMEFYVKNKAELKPLKIGDQVDFVLEYKHPTETIVTIKKAQ